MKRSEHIPDPGNSTCKGTVVTQSGQKTEEVSKVQKIP